jgi:hypothetical protein
MNRKAVALLSGGLDSRLAIRILQQQGIAIEALNFRTIFGCCKDEASQAAHELGVRLTVVGMDESYLDIIKRPKYGYGKGINPCVDCRIYLFEIARKFMDEVGASFVVSGEVVGQRPMSQKRRDLDIIARDAALEDLLLRPLSAKLLPPTLPERLGVVDRERLFGVEGRSRKGLIELARQFGFNEIPQPSTGCALTEPLFANKVRDLIELAPQARQWDFELLRIGRHFRFDVDTKVVLGRDERQNEQLRLMAAQDNASPCWVVEPENFTGPTALVTGPHREDAAQFVTGLIARYSRSCDPDKSTVACEVNGRRTSLPIYDDALAATTETI